ncbi:MAG: signal peptidase I [Dehalococcoidia bacterium]|nr:MAG: signal peptidase I [Dehalococcoidia bacterium]
MRFKLREILVIILLAVAIFLLLQSTVQSFKVEGFSMEPSFHNGQYLAVNKAVYWFGDPQRGEVIVFRSLENPDRDLIKRVIALPGETVEIKEGRVYIDGAPLDEPYIIEEPDYTYPSRQVPPDFYFVLGDNRNSSSDSHVWGMLPREYIIGKAWFCYWPLSEWQLVPTYPFEQ